MQRTSRSLILAASILLLVGATGCGSGSDGGDKKQSTTTEASSSVTESDTSSAGKPDTAALVKGIEKGFSVSRGQAKCVAKKVMDKLPATALSAIAQNKPASEVPTGEQRTLAKELRAAIAACP